MATMHWMSMVFLGLTATLASGLQVVPADGGATIALRDGAGRLASGQVAIWDRDWAHVPGSRQTDLTGDLANGLTGRLKLPGRLPGEAVITQQLRSLGDRWQYTVSLQFTAAADLNVAAVQFDLPLARLAGATFGQPAGDSEIAVTEEPFGGTLGGGGALLRFADGQALLLASSGGDAILIQDNRRYNTATVSCRIPLVSGAVRAGQRVTRTVQLAAGEVDAMRTLHASLNPPESFTPGEPAMVVRETGVVALLANDLARWGELALGVHGRGWAHLAQGGGTTELPTSDRSDGQRTLSGWLPVPGTTDGRIHYDQTLSRTATGLQVDYLIRRPTPLPLNSHHASLNLDLDALTGQELVLTGPGGERRVRVPAEHGEVHLAVETVAGVRLLPGSPRGLTLTVDPPTELLVQDNRRFNSSILELRFRLGDHPSEDLPAGERTLRLTIEPEVPTQVLLAAEEAVNVTDRTGWFAYTLPWDSAPVDLSALNHKPAGRHGFLTRRGRQFVFEDGTPARFWGVNFSAGANFPTHQQAELIARRLARFGVNIVRTHHADANWARPNFFQFEDIATGNTTEFVAESMDRFDYLIHCLRQEGIYIYLDQLVHRKFTAADGVDAVEQLDNAGKPYSNFDPKLIAAQQAFSRRLLEHVNPYTQLAYKDDPAIVLMEFANENDLMTQRVELEPYRSRLEQQYRAWAADRGVAVPAGPVSFDFQANTDVLRFLVEVQRDYYREMTAFMRGLGVRIPLTGSNWSRNAGLLVALSEVDFTDSHAYHDHPSRAGTLSNRPYIGREGSMIGSLGFNRAPDRPFFVSEWDTPWPNDWRAELPLWLAAAAAFQEWDGLTVYTYRHNATVPIEHISGAFETFNDPTRFGLFPAAALLYRRGDVAAASERVTVRIDPESALTAPSPGPWSQPALLLTPDRHQVAVTVGEAPPDAGRIVALSDRVVPPASEVVSDTGQLRRRLGSAGYGVVDTPRSQAAYGHLGAAGVIPLAGGSLAIDTPFAAVAVSSLTDAPLTASRTTLVTAVARAENTGTSFNLDRTRLLSGGQGPILCEPVTGSIRLTVGHPTWREQLLAADGSIQAERLLTAADGVLTVTLAADDRTIYRRLEAVD